MRKPRSIIAILWLSLVAGVLPAFSQTAAPVQEPQRKTSTPYSGDLTIFDYPDRDQKLHVNQVMELLGITAGKSVADIGAGSGWFTVRAARRVTQTGKVYAMDINPEAVRYINDRGRKEGLRNITTILSTPDDPQLPPSSVDAVLLLKTYHEVAKPVQLMQKVRVALSPGARVGIIDRNGNGENHGIGSEVIIREADEAGYKLLGKYDFVKDGMDYFLVLTAKE